MARNIIFCLCGVPLNKNRYQCSICGATYYPQAHWLRYVEPYLINKPRPVEVFGVYNGWPKGKPRGHRR